MDNFAPPHKRTPSIALNSAKKYVSRVHRNSKLILTFNIMAYATREKKISTTCIRGNWYRKAQVQIYAATAQV
jgi:hypothetical protein